VHLQTVFPLSAARRNFIDGAIKQKAADIIAGKGAPAFGIGAVVASICDSILLDQRQVRSLSHWQGSLGCCLSIPAVLGSGGILSTINVPLDNEERDLLEVSAKSLRRTIETIMNVQEVENDILNMS